jgi:uncharacterized protein YbgA (DUF1722 family)/uncharacterized protein YbbK (DUF523 family)
VELGLSIPRPSLRLVGETAETARLLVSSTGEDLTERMEAWARGRVAELAAENLCGFIFKAKSPSSGMERVKLYDRHGMPHKTASGVFARIFMDNLPLIPVEEEGRLHDAGLKENFIESIFTFQRWRDLLQAGLTPAALVEFHTRHKLLLLSHSPEIYRQMGRLVAQAGSLPPAALQAEYQTLLLQAMRRKATVKKQLNVLQHVLGYFKRSLTADEKQETLELFDTYRRELVPLLVPITLLNHFSRKYGPEWLRQQVYLHPHPLELKLRVPL